MTEAAALKRTMRTEAKRRLAALGETAAQKASDAACQALQDSELWQNSAIVAGFIPLSPAHGREVDLKPLLTKGLKDGKVICLPRTEWAGKTMELAQIRSFEIGKDLRERAMGLIEPNEGCPAWSLGRLSLVLVPGLAFDNRGRRLGRGGGFYDRWIGAGPNRGERAPVYVGVCFGTQIVDEVPIEAHDSTVNFLLTESGLIAVEPPPPEPCEDDPAEAPADDPTDPDTDIDTDTDTDDQADPPVDPEAVAEAGESPTRAPDA